MKPCLEPGCPNDVEQGQSRCQLHAPAPWAGRAPFKERYGISPAKWQKLRAKALRRDGYRCVNCGATKMLQVDHIVGAAAGGQSVLSNLQTLCPMCHAKKTREDRRR